MKANELTFDDGNQAKHLTARSQARGGGDVAGETRPPLSCYIRTMNEAHRLGSVIEAARQVAREVVVVDSGSSDGTQAIALGLGARVIDRPGPRYGQQKRVGEEACTHDWLLDLDADEVVDAELATAICDLFANAEPSDTVYQLKMVMQPPVGRRWDQTMLTYRAKLYDRRRHRMPDSEIWDQLELSGPEPKTLDGAIIHYSFVDFADLVGKYNRVSSARAKYMKPRSMLQLRLRVLFAYPFYFLKHYVMRGLFRAGIYGFAFAGIAAHARWLRDVKMYEAGLLKNQKKNDILDYSRDLKPGE